MHLLLLTTKTSEYLEREREREGKTERAYALVIANLLCFPEASRYTLDFETFNPRFLRAFICRTTKTKK
jgi:hypothetical protein